MPSQTMTPQAPAPAPAPADERLARVGLVARLLQRPEFGALLGAIAVFVAFSITGDQFGTLGGAARWTDVASTYGMMAVVVALLMIARRVRPLGRRDDRHRRASWSAC